TTLIMDPRTSAQDVMGCNLCETAVVQMHCDTCLVNLCTACVGKHFSVDFSKPHKIVDFKDRKSTPSTLYKHLVDINKTMSDIKDEINSLEIAIDTNDLSELLSVTPNVQIYRNLPHKITLSLPKFIPGKIHEELSKIFGTVSSSSFTSDKHGYSMKTTQKSPEAGSSPPVKQLLDEPETVTTIDTGINQGSLLKSITTKSGNRPWDIAVTISGDLVYTDYSNRTVNIVKNEKIEEVIRLQNCRPSGVCCTSSGDLLIIMNMDILLRTGTWISVCLMRDLKQ
ncbi:uncharacterized protein LOC134262553, partial [Saccostrea cucullata]|uniref:uncharacterized protein LOC134262553 n=1 Tax=Saccostrea cuccullata TaxID=36930 RepID=UPI002ED4C66B